MKYILDDKKILDFLAEKKISMTKFAQDINLDWRAMNRALGGVPVLLSTAQKIARAMDIHPHAVILCSFSPRERKKSYERNLEQPKNSKVPCE